MQIEIQARDIRLTRSIHQFIQRRIHFAFARFHQHIQRISVRLSDINGPKGGRDKRCQFLIEIPNKRDIFVKAQAHRVEAAIAKAAARSSLALSRELARNQRLHKRYLANPQPA